MTSTTTTAIPQTTTAAAPSTSSTIPEPTPEPPPPEPGRPLPEGTQGVAVVAAGGAGLATEPNGTGFVVAREGLVFPVEDRQGDWLQVLTPCDERAWVSGGQVSFTPRMPEADVGEGFSLDRAVIVLDPGHGGPNRGAIGRTGLEEAVVNVEIARRARDLLTRARHVDWPTGVVTEGSSVPPAGAVWLTRTEGPPGADYEAGLLFRAQLANMAGAQALVSIHNNADPDGPFEGPGSETFFSIEDERSRRLAGLMVEELRRSLRHFDVAWVGDTDAGAKYRLRDDGETDYYGILRASEVPDVIAEGAFVSNPEEEALLRTAEFQQAYAEAVYRALVRFLTTDDQGSGYTEPYPRTTPAGSGAPQPDCTVPVQP